MLKAQISKTRIYFTTCIFLFIAIISCIFFGEKFSQQRTKQLLSLREDYSNSNSLKTNTEVPANNVNAPETKPVQENTTQPVQNNLQNNDAVLLKPGDSGIDVTNLQKKLYELGYDLTIDGSYGNQTVKILKTIQTDNKLNASGNYTVETKKILDKLKTVRTYKKP